MAVNEVAFGPGGQYRLRITVNVSGQNPVLGTTTYSWSVQVIRASGSGYQSSYTATWSIGHSGASNFKSGSIAGYNFTQYSTLTLGSGSRTVAGQGTMNWAAGFGDPSGDLGSASVTIQNLTPPSMTPSAPTNLAATKLSNGHINLTWKRSGKDWSQARVEFSTDGSTWSMAGFAQGNATSFTFVAGLPNSRLRFRVAGENGVGTGPWSNTAEVWTTPSAPSGLSATRVSDSRIDLSWTVNALSQSSAIIQRSVNGGSWSQIGTVSGAASSYSDTKTSANNRYQYRVISVNPGGQSGYSNTAERWTSPAAPSGVSAAKVSDSRIDVSFTVNARGQTSALVERSVNGGAWSQIGTVSGTGTKYSDTGVSANNRYQYRIRSVAPGGTSGYSNTAERWTSPAAPSGVSASRASDAQHNVSWTVNARSQSAAVVQQRVNGGSWTEVGRPTGTASAFTVTGGQGDRAYEYRVASVNPGGQSGWVYSSTLYTTPAAPSGVSAERVTQTQIRVDASTKPPYATSYDIRDGGTLVASGVSLPWAHENPNPATPHVYTVQAKRGSLASAWSSASNTVQLLAAPNAATGLGPNGTVLDYAGDVRFEWKHNPVDSSAQTQFQVRRRLVGASTWVEWGIQTDSRQYRSVPASTVGDAPGIYEWQVRTRGQHPDWGPWSATALLTTIDAPGVAINSPEESWNASTLPVEWAYTQVQDRPQSAWEARLIHDSTIVEARSGSGDAATLTFAWRLTPGEWTVAVRAASGPIWSGWAEQTFTVYFAPPAAPSLAGAWDETTGTVALQLAAGSDPGLPDTVSLVLERSIDAGESWEPVAATEELDTAVVDGESLSYGVTRYRLTALTVEDVPESAEITVEARSLAVWLSTGSGFLHTARLPFDPQVGVSVSRERELKRYAGRSRPVSYSGEAVTRVWQVSGLLADRALSDEEVASVDQMAAIAVAESPIHLLRDPDGRRTYGQIGVVDMPRNSSTVDQDGWVGLWGYSFELTETERS